MQHPQRVERPQVIDAALQHDVAAQHCRIGRGQVQPELAIVEAHHLDAPLFELR